MYFHTTAFEYKKPPYFIPVSVIIKNITLSFPSTCLSNVDNFSLTDEVAPVNSKTISNIIFSYVWWPLGLIKEILIKNNLTTEKYIFDEDGFNTHYYLEENSKVVNAQRYIHQPYYRGDIKQEYTEDTAKTVVINAKKDTLYTSSLNDFVFIDGDSVTTTLNMFELPLQKYAIKE